MRILLITLMLLVPRGGFSEITLEEAKTNGMLETLRDHIEHSDFIVDICIYEQEWINPTERFKKGRLYRRAVVTGVHKGEIKIGTKIEYYHPIEEPPTLFKNFRSVVEGELRTSFFSRSDGTLSDGRYTLGNAHWGIGRTSGVFRDLFLIEKKTNKALRKNNGEQTGADRPLSRK